MPVHPRGRGRPGPCRKSPTMGSVHPRGRGEHTSPRIALDAAVIHPRGARGTPRPPIREAEIHAVHPPAGAGNTRPARSSSIICCGSSPRARETRDGLAKISSGSRLSPRARGTHASVPHGGGVPTGYIPAGAGNTAWPGQAVHRSAVDPRGRGEHLSITATTSGERVHPRGRGEHNTESPTSACACG